MNLMERYQEAIDELFAKVRRTQTDAIIKAGELIAESASKGGEVKISLNILLPITLTLQNT